LTGIHAGLLKVAKQVAVEYEAELKRRIGSPSKDSGDQKLWHESGELEGEITVTVELINGQIRLFVGVLKSSATYDKALWNEFGFHNSDGKVVRRPLFTPLAEKYTAELAQRVKEAFNASNRKLR